MSKLVGKKHSFRLPKLHAIDISLLANQLLQDIVNYSSLLLTIITVLIIDFYDKLHASLQTSHFLSCKCAALGILILSGIVLLPILLPVAITDNNLKISANSSTSNGTFSDLDKLSMGNIKVSTGLCH